MPLTSKGLKTLGTMAKTYGKEKDKKEDSKPGTKGAPTAKAFRESAKTAKKK